MNHRITKDEACRLLACTARTLERKTKSERLSVTHRQAGRVRIAEYNREEILELKKRMTAPVHQAVVMDGARGREDRGTGGQGDGATGRPGDTTRHGSVGAWGIGGQRSAVSGQPGSGEVEMRRALGEFATAQRVLAAQQKLGLGVREAALLTGLPRTIIRAAIKAQRLKAARRGRALHIKRADLNRWFAGL